MIINGDGGYGLLAACIGGPAAQADWLGPKVSGRLASFLYVSREPSELSQWLCYDDSTINIVVVIIIIIIMATGITVLGYLAIKHSSMHPSNVIDPHQLYLDLAGC